MARKIVCVARSNNYPVALTIAGSDSGGGAGIQADLKTFASLDVHGTSAITCITAQNPNIVRAIQPVTPAMVRQQIEAIFTELKPSAGKTGMLYSSGIIREVGKFFSRRRFPLVNDPVMTATSGSRLLRPGTLKDLKKLFDLAILITPNLVEAELILGRSIRSEEAMRRAAKDLHRQFGCAALVKGGHLRGSNSAVDIFFDGHNELLLSAPYFRGIRTHGTGCTYSAAITAYLARRLPLQKAVELGKKYVTQSIAKRIRVGNHSILNSFWSP